jgi:hypothetical protein
MGVCPPVCSAAVALTLIFPQVTSEGVRRRETERVVANDAATVTQFADRIDEYLKLHRRQEADIGSLPKTADPAAITRRQHDLGEAIRQARSGAHEGDIFTSDAAALIRRLIAADLARRNPVDRRAFIASQPEVTMRVNDFYPTTVPLATVPPELLNVLPHLPQALQYRFVGASLILFDVDPNLVVDILPDAVPARYRQP